jgi:hypothetical protein
MKKRAHLPDLANLDTGLALRVGGTYVDGLGDHHQIVSSPMPECFISNTRDAFYANGQKWSHHPASKGHLVRELEVAP